MDQAPAHCGRPLITRCRCGLEADSSGHAAAFHNPSSSQHGLLKRRADGGHALPEHSFESTGLCCLRTDEVSPVVVQGVAYGSTERTHERPFNPLTDVWGLERMGSCRAPQALRRAATFHNSYSPDFLCRLPLSPMPLPSYNSGQAAAIPCTTTSALLYSARGPCHVLQRF
uniref:Uncharacterized protein n=1 Tax=Eutreptiella gymnastica TaxID=73025 RepID=A0A7S4LKE4_9EUGL